MSVEFGFFTSIGLSFVAWGLLISRYVWPRLRPMPRTEALQLLLLPHAFRFVGLAFLVPGVVSPDLPPAFARAAAYGDIVAATLALLSLLTVSRGFGVPLVWIFNVWGTADLLTGFYEANRSGLLAGQLGATYFIPTVVVPLLLITHAVVFRLLLQRSSSAAAQERQLARERPTAHA